MAASGIGRTWSGALAGLPGGWLRLGAIGWVGVALTVTVGLWLAAIAAASSVRVVMSRRAHRCRLDAVAEILDHQAGAGLVGAGTGRGPTPGRVGMTMASGSVVQAGAEARGRVATTSPGDRPETRPGVLSRVHLVDHPAAVAYCLPGIRPRIVVSSGVLRALDRDELAAVVAHERAHAHGHHDLVIQPFVAWRTTFPFLPAASAALAAVDLLVEMLADDTASRHCPRAHMHTALATLAAAAHHDDHRLQAQIAARAVRLAVTPRPVPRLASALLYLAAAAIVLLPPAILLFS